MNQINDLPPEYTFGTEFNYAVWDANTRLTLANVPWNSDYRDTVWFDTTEQLNTYIDSVKGPQFTTSTYAKAYEPVRVDLPFNQCYKYNYLRVFNPAQPVSDDADRYLYYFITDVKYVAPNTTELVLSLDVWQTFIRTCSFGRCYIERGHIGIANENAFRNNGRDFLAIPEGFDLGSDYVVRWAKNRTVAGLAENDNPSRVLVVSTVSLEDSGGTVQNPNLVMADGSMLGRMPNGTSIYLFSNEGNFLVIMSALKEKPWITQGIVSITTIPDPGNSVITKTVSIAGGSVKKITGGAVKPEVINLWENWREGFGFGGGRYWRLKKFLTYPYTVVELTTYSGNPIILKPECMEGSDLKVTKFLHVGPPNPRIAFAPYKYNSSGMPDVGGTGADPLRDDGGDFLDLQTGIFNFPQSMVVNNGTMAYLASNANTIAYQHKSASWAETKALKAASTGYDVARRGMDASQAATDRSIMANNQMNALGIETAGYRAIQSGANSLTGGLMSGNALGAAGAVIGVANAAAGYAIDTNQMNKSTAISNSLAYDQTQISVSQQDYAARANRDLANFAAKGDYANAIAGINARVQDANMIPPTTSGQIGGDAFNMATLGRWILSARVKQIDNATMATIGEYWLRYGYAVQRFATPPANLKCMTDFTYWKMLETYITSSRCPETFKQTIRGILEKGVTVWSDPKKIGKTDPYYNEPLKGISL